MTPEGWRQIRYGDAMVEIGDRAEAAVDLPVLSVTKTRGPMLASDRFGKVMHGRNLSRYRVARRDQVVADPMLLWDGAIGLQTVVDAGLVSPDYRVYQPAPDVAPAFLGYVVRSPQMLPHYEGGARGTNVRRNRIARADFLAIPLALPAFAEQEKIASILSSVDDAIEASQSVIHQLGVVKKAMMAELLTRGLPGRHTRFKETDVGTLPEGWRAVRVGDLLTESAYGTSAKCDTAGEGLPVLRIPNVVQERVLFENLKFASLPENEVASNRLREGDLLVVRTNGNPDYVGRSAVFPAVAGNWLYASYLIRLRLKEGLVLPSFAHEALRSSAVRKTMEGAIRTSAGNYNLNTRGIANTVVPLPDLREQEEIVRIAGTLRGRVDAENDSLTALRSAKRALMSVLLTGELRVKPDPAAP